MSEKKKNQPKEERRGRTDREQSSPLARRPDTQRRDGEAGAAGRCGLQVALWAKAGDTERTASLSSAWGHWEHRQPLLCMGTPGALPASPLHGATESTASRSSA